MRGKRSTSSPVSDSVRRVRWSVSSSRGGRSSRSWRTTSTASPGSEGVPSCCSLVVMVGLALGFDFFEHVQWPFDPFPNFAGGCWPPSVMPWYFLEGPKNVPSIC